MKIYAHRGSSLKHPELTLDAYKAAVDDGADGFECDVRITQDKKIVLWHDSDMDRICGDSRNIANLTLSQIRDIYPKVMTLEELLTLARDNKKDLAIETKHPVPTGSLIEKEVLKLLSQEKHFTEIYLMSFSWLALEKVRQLAPHQKTVALIGNHCENLMRRFTSASGLGENINTFLSKPHLAKDERDLFVWTVDDAEDMLFCANHGVDVLITNTPSYARSVLGYH